MRILLLTGGNSSERKISLLSAMEVKKTLLKNGHLVKIYDVKNGYLPIKNFAKEYDMLFPVLHGEEGEGGKLHKYLFGLKKPVVGSKNYKGFQNAWYKIPFKKFCDKNGIKTSKWKVVKNKNDVIRFGFPCVLKASNGGSSREVIILKSEKDLKKNSFKKLINLKTPLFVEQYLKGNEVTVGIINNKVLPIIEIIPPKGSWFSYKNKYTNSTQEIPFAPSLDNETQEKIKIITLNIHNLFALGTYSRIDFIVCDKIPYVLDVNTIPGLTLGSLLPKQAKAAGMTFNQMVEELVKSAR